MPKRPVVLPNCSHMAGSYKGVWITCCGPCYELALKADRVLLIRRIKKLISRNKLDLDKLEAGFLKGVTLGDESDRTELERGQEASRVPDVRGGLSV